MKDNLILLSDLQEFSNQIFIKYSHYRSILSISNENFPAYELAKLYYELAFQWFEYAKTYNLALNICKEYLEKCIDVFDSNQTIDICKNAKCVLESTLKQLEKNYIEIKLDEKCLSLETQIDKTLLSKKILKIARNYLCIGDFDRVGHYLDYIDKTFSGVDFENIQKDEDLKEILLLLKYGQAIKTQLDLQESLMHLDQEDHIEVQFKLEENLAQMRETFRTWKNECNKIKDSVSGFCGLKFVDENDDKVDPKPNRDILIKSHKNKRFSVVYKKKSSNKNEESEIKDRLLLNILSTRKFEASVSTYLVERLNTVLAKLDSAHFLTPNLKNRILLLANKNELRFYLYSFVIKNQDNSHYLDDAKIIGDVIFPSETNAKRSQLWLFLSKVFSGKKTIAQDEFVKILANEHYKQLFGSLHLKLPLLKIEKIENTYKELSVCSEILRNFPLAKEYLKMSLPEQEEIKEDLSFAKNELLKQHILSNDGLILPGDEFLNKPIDENDFFTLVVPRLKKENISVNNENVYTGLHACIKVMPVWVELKTFSPDLDWFDDGLLGDFYKREQQNSEKNFGKLVYPCLLIYLCKQNSWAIMVKISDKTKIQGFLKDLENELKSINFYLVNVKKSEDFDCELPDEKISRIATKSSKFEFSLSQTEKTVNLFLKKNFFFKNNNNEVAHLQILKKGYKTDFEMKKKIYDITTIGDVISLRSEIKAFREGYFVMIRKSTNTEEVCLNDYSNVVQLTSINDQFYVHGRNQAGDWIDQQMELDENEKRFLFKKYFESIPAGSPPKKIFVSSIQNAFLFKLIENQLSKNMNSRTKKKEEDAFFSLIKVDYDHYVALGILKSNQENNEYTIYLGDPDNKMVNYVEFLEVIGRDFSYSFDPKKSFVICSHEKSKGNSLIKAYITLKTMKVLWQNGIEEKWNFFLNFFCYQYINDAKNLETIKKWYIDLDGETQNEPKKETDEKLNIDTSEEFLVALKTLDSNFESKICSINEIGLNDKSDLKNILLEASYSLNFVNKLRKIEFENYVSLNLLIEIKKENPNNSFQSVDISFLLDKLKISIEKQKEFLDIDLYKSLMIALEKAYNSSKLEQEDLKNFLENLAQLEKNGLIIEIGDDAQNKINSFFNKFYNQINANCLTVGIETQLDQKNLKYLKKHLSSTICFRNVRDLIEFRLFLNEFLKPEEVINSPNFNDLLVKLEYINTSNETLTQNLKKIFINNYECIKFKADFVLIFFEQFTKFLELFIKEILENYNAQDLSQCYELIYEEVEKNLKNDKEFIKLMPANGQAREIINFAENNFAQDKNFRDNEQFKQYFKNLLENLIRDVALKISRQIPSYISNYRHLIVESLENLYLELHELLSNDIQVLNQKFRFILCENFPQNQNEYPEKCIFVKKISTTNLESLYQVSFFSNIEKKIIADKKFSTDKIFFSTGVFTFEDELEEKILNSMEYFKFNKDVELIVKRCSNCFKGSENNEVNILEQLINLLFNEKFIFLKKNLPEMQKNKCGTYIYLNEYFTAIKSFVVSFEKIFKVLKLIKEELRQALADKFDFIPDDLLEMSFKTELLDKISSKTKLKDVLSCIDGLKFKNESLIQEILNDLDNTFETRKDTKGKFDVCSLLKEFVLNVIEKYMNDLILFRERLKQTFKLIEIETSKILSSYELIKNRENFLNKIKQNMICFNATKNYGEKLNFYLLTVKIILNEEKSNFKEEDFNFIFNSEKKLESLNYVEQFQNLTKIFENFSNPIGIDVEKSNDNLTIYVNTKSALLSEITDKIKQCIPRQLEAGDEIHIINSDKVYLDCDLKYASVNIILVGVEFELIPVKYQFFLDTSGLNATKHKNEQAISGKDGNSTTLNGENGLDGLDGLPGGHAGNIFIIANKLPNPNNAFFTACGGNGENGQIGGHGGNGYDGNDGYNGNKTRAKRILFQDIIGDYTRSTTNYFSGVCWDIGTEGSEGGNGGDSGFSGYGGNGGNSGTIVIKSASYNFTNKKQNNGAKGNDGNYEKALPGKAGKHGKDGLTIIMTADIIRLFQINGEKDKDESHMNFYNCRCYDRGYISQNTGYNTKTKADRSNTHGFVYRSKAATYHTAGWCRPYVNSNLYEYDERTINKYECLAKIGKKNQLKNSNRQLAKKVNAINEHDVYTKVKFYLEKFRNKSSSEYQHWQSSKITQLLNSFLDELNENEDSLSIESSNLHDKLTMQINNAFRRLKQEELEIKNSLNNLNTGLVKHSLEILNEIQQINMNEKLWKKINQTKTDKKNQMLVDKQNEFPSASISDNNLRVITNHLECESENNANIEIGNDMFIMLRIHDIDTIAARKKFIKIDNLIKELNKNLSSKWFEDTQFKKINNYPNQDFIDCLEKIKNDKRFLFKFKHDGHMDIKIVFIGYLEIVSLNQILENFLIQHKIDQNTKNILMSMITSELAFQDEKDPHLLLHKILFIFLIERLQNSFKGVHIVQSEIYKIVKMFFSFFTLSNACKSLDGFKGTISQLKKAVLISLFKDTVENCFPNLTGSFRKEKMINIDANLLLIFYNKLQIEYQDYNVKLNKIQDLPMYLCIDNEKVVQILKSLNDESISRQVIFDYDLKVVLSQASLNSWVEILNEVKLSMFFSDILKRSEIDLKSKRVNECLRLLNSLRLQLKDEQFSQFISINDTFTNIPDKTDPLRPFYNLILSLYSKKISFEDGLLVKSQSYNNWDEEIETIISKKNSFVKPVERNVDELFESLKQLNDDLNMDFLSQVKENLNSINNLIKEKKAKINENPAQKHNLLQSWLEETKNNESKKYEFISNLAIAWYIEKNQIPKQTQLAAFLLFIESFIKKESLLEQINTGEGKTLTVAFLAAYLALKGHNVDVLSSNRDLAIDGEKKCASFFSILGLKSNHNCHLEEQDRTRAYKCHIVYGEVSSFQGDMLDSKFNKRDICGDRYMNMAKVCLVVDEVDSMCLDKAKDVLYLSHEIECLKWLEGIFIHVWVAALKENPADEDQIKNSQKKVSELIISLIRSKKVSAPSYLTKYIESKIDLWTESAFQAKSMNANDEFVIDLSKEAHSKHKKIIVLDKDVGVEMYSSRWSNGLAQFLELKYRRKISVESLKAVFMSNKKFFELYGARMYGLTGTLGGKTSRRFLKDIYKTNFLNIPSSYPKQFYFETPRIATTVKEWLHEIFKSIKDHRNRPVLVITDTVQNAELIINHLKNEGVSQNKIRPYTRDSDEVELYYNSRPANTGDIIVATNKGGRGTDIKVSEVNNKEYGGLHVILAYLPSNDRIEEQAFGRTSRNGNRGSGEFILLVDENDEGLANELVNLDPDERLEKLNELAASVLQKKKDKQNKSIEIFIDDLLKTGILHLDIEQNLFDKFKEIFDVITRNAQPIIDKYVRDIGEKVAKLCYKGHDEIKKHGLLEKSLDSVGGYEGFRSLKWKDFSAKIKENLVDKKFKKDLEEFVANVVKDKWAFWLESVQEEIKKSQSLTIQAELIKKIEIDFKSLMDERFGYSITDLLGLTECPEQQLKLARLFLEQGQIREAEQCFDKAKHEDATGVSYVGLAYCNIPSGSQNENEAYQAKKRVRRLLKKARSKIESMQRDFIVNRLFAEKLPKLTEQNFNINRYVSPQDNFYCSQIESKSKVLDAHLYIINKAIGKSMNPDHFVQDKIDEKKSEEIYFKFVNANIIHHNRIRREHVDKNTNRLNRMALDLINSNMDKSIAEPIIELLNSNINENHIAVEKFEEIMRDRDEFWSIIKSCAGTCETVQVLDLAKAYNELEEEYKPFFSQMVGVYEMNIMSIDELPAERTKLNELFGENLTLVRINKDNSIFLYYMKEKKVWDLKKLASEVYVLECNELPADEIVAASQNKVYCKITESLFSFSYFSPKQKDKIVKGQLKKSDDRKLFELLKNQSINRNSVILSHTLGLNDEPLYKLDFDQNLSVEISLFLENETSKIVCNKIVSAFESGVFFKFINPFNVTDDLFNNEPKLNLKKKWVDSNILKKEERVRIEYIEPFIDVLKNYFSKCDEKLKTKYASITYMEHTQDGLVYFLSDLLKKKLECAEKSLRNYLYANEIPFDTKIIEAKANIKILHDLSILKSGGLALEKHFLSGDVNKSKYGYDKKKFKENIEKKIDKSYHAHIDKAVELQGDMRSFRDGLKGWLRQFTEIDLGANESELPDELGFFADIGFDRVLVLEELKKFRFSWAAFGVFILGMLQVVVGACLAVMGMHNLSNVFLSEGLSDMVDGLFGMITGEFDAADWALKKKASLAMFIMAGLSDLLDPFKIFSLSGMLSKGLIFTKAILKTVNKLNAKIGGKLTTRINISKVMEFIDKQVAAGLKPKIKECVKFDRLKERLKEIRNKKGDRAFQDALFELKSSIMNVTKEKSVQKAIFASEYLSKTIISIKTATKRFPPSSTSISQKLAKVVANQITLLENNTWFACIEVPEILTKVDEFMLENLDSFEKNFKADQEENLAQKEEEDKNKDVDEELNNFFQELSEPITNNLSEFMSGLINEAFKTSVTVGSTSMYELIENRLARKFEGNSKKITRIDREVSKKNLITNNKFAKERTKEQAKEDYHIENEVNDPKKTNQENFNALDTLNLKKGQYDQPSQADAKSKADKSSRSYQTSDVTKISLKKGSVWDKLEDTVKITSIVNVESKIGSEKFKENYSQGRTLKKRRSSLVQEKKQNDENEKSSSGRLKRSCSIKWHISSKQKKFTDLYNNENYDKFLTENFLSNDKKIKKDDGYFGINDLDKRNIGTASRYKSKSFIEPFK